MIRCSVLFVFGTRPEAIKLCPLILALRSDPGLSVRVCVTGQHRDMLDEVLATFQVMPDHDLRVMRPDQTLAQTTARILRGLEAVLGSERPGLVAVQGDTTTTMAGALAAFYAGVPVAHVEAGLRTGDMKQPFPEEMNRVVVSRLSALHFAATEWAASNLRREGVPETAISVTGNTGIDAVLTVAGRLAGGQLMSHPICNRLDSARKLLVVTAHRRESFGEGIAGICDALATLAQRRDVQIVYPVHPNPNVSKAVYQRLGNIPGITLICPLDYTGFVDLMRRAYLLLTDSGGVQEEGPSLGKPVLVMRDTTERPEAVAAGTAVLVGSRKDSIVAATTTLLDDAHEYQRRSRIHNPYGDGRACQRIHSRIRQYFCLE